MVNTKLIKKIRERKGIPIRELAKQTGLTKAQMGVSDYFIPSTYKDNSGKESELPRA
jgi:transcriptional regulator with XRE-family HTH domain